MPASTGRSPHKPTKTLSLPSKGVASQPAAPAEHAGRDASDSQKQVTPEKEFQVVDADPGVIARLNRAISREKAESQRCKNSNSTFTE